VTMDADKTIVAEFRGATAVPAPALPGVTELSPPSPNPGSSPLRIEFSVARRGPVRLRVFDVTGREVAALVRGMRDPGRYSVSWRPATESGVRPGVYLVRLEAADRITTRRVVVLE